MINTLFTYIQRNAFTLIVMTLVIYFCCRMGVGPKPAMSLVVGMLPASLLLLMACVRWPGCVLLIAGVANYVIMGLTRYISIPVPITILFEAMFAMIFVAFTLRIFNHKVDIISSFNIYWLFLFIWFAYCMINVGNGVTGRLRPSEWYRSIRAWGVYPLVISIIIALHAKHYSFIQKFLILWAILTLAASAKGYYQRNSGFDQAEWAWLWAGGAKTHLISTGVRYFSFFTDAANFGCSMGVSLVVFTIAALYNKNLILRLLYLAAAAAGGYGMLISGTRAAIAVPIVGMAMYTVLCKNWKVCVASGTGLVLGLFILMFTQIGDNNPLVHRMRTAFDRDDASMNVRLENQKAIKAYMKEAPFGIGVGLDWTNLSNKNKFYIVASTPPDSDLVNIWIHLGEVGLVVYLLLQGLTLAVGSYLLLFRIQSIEIRGPLVGMICGCGGILVASYANMVYFQYPNGPLIYTCLTLVFLGPYFDKQYIAAKAQKEIETKQNDIAEAN
jgi:hypothetical protein